MDLRESRTSEGVRHPWERARFAFLASLLERHGRLASARVLDVGSGDAYLAKQLLGRLAPGSSIDCVDAHYDDTIVASLALPPGISARSAPTDAHYDLVMALDVAEHVEDDVAFLSSLRARLAPTGALLFTVPAWPALFSDHDRALGHHRRYTHASARALLATTGFRVVESGGFFHALVLPRLMSVATELARGPRSVPVSEGEWTLGEGLSSSIARVLELEHRLTHALGKRGLALPGLSFYALAVPV